MPLCQYFEISPVGENKRFRIVCRLQKTAEGIQIFREMTVDLVQDSLADARPVLHRYHREKYLTRTFKTKYLQLGVPYLGLLTAILDRS